MSHRAYCKSNHVSSVKRIIPWTASSDACLHTKSDSVQPGTWVYSYIRDRQAIPVIEEKKERSPEVYPSSTTYTTVTVSSIRMISTAYLVTFGILIGIWIPVDPTLELQGAQHPTTSTGKMYTGVFCLPEDL